jgi:hypothetical protein
MQSQELLVPKNHDQMQGKVQRHPSDTFQGQVSDELLDQTIQGKATVQGQIMHDQMQGTVQVGQMQGHPNYGVIQNQMQMPMQTTFQNAMKGQMQGVGHMPQHQMHHVMQGHMHDRSHEQHMHAMVHPQMSMQGQMQLQMKMQGQDKASDNMRMPLPTHDLGLMESGEDLDVIYNDVSFLFLFI